IASGLVHCSAGRSVRAATRGWGTLASVGGEPGGTSASIHGLGYLFSALRREGLIADELVLQLATFLRSLDLFLELTVRTVPRTLTTNQVRRGRKQGTDGPELSRIHSRTQIHATNGGKPQHMAPLTGRPQPACSSCCGRMSPLPAGRVAVVQVPPRPARFWFRSVGGARLLRVPHRR